jgi:hypothetical protein
MPELLPFELALAESVFARLTAGVPDARAPVLVVVQLPRLTVGARQEWPTATSQREQVLGYVAPCGPLLGHYWATHSNP